MVCVKILGLTETFRADYIDWCLPLFDDGSSDHNDYSCSFFATAEDMFFVNFTASSGKWEDYDCCLFEAGLAAVPPDWMKAEQYNGTDVINDIPVDVWWFPGTSDPSKPCYGYWNAKDELKTPVRFFGLSSLGPTILDYRDFEPQKIPQNIEMTKPNDNCHKKLISISKPSNFITVWIGLISNGTNSSYFGVSSSCYIYCSFNPKYTTFVVNESEITLANSSNISDRINICIDNREGPLCSQCITGYSAVFGSPEFYLLYALKLTLTSGTINSFIFYAQILAVVENPELHHSYLFNFILLSKSIVALFNLSFYYPLCFYDGMSELMKSGIVDIL
uniref:Uncharacterized protein n=1 Tax=Amphimedon queenslandica TaxID=400682 RepID=A0A1X7U0R2_AMPQE